MLGHLSSVDRLPFCCQLTLSSFSYSVIYQHTKDKPKIKTTRTGQTKLKTTKRLFVCDNYVYIAVVFVFSCKEVINLLYDDRSLLFLGVSFCTSVQGKEDSGGK